MNDLIPDLSTSKKRFDWYLFQSALIAIGQDWSRDRFIAEASKAFDSCDETLGQLIAREK